MTNMENKEESSENLGRKIFFLHPTVTVQSQVIEELIQEEFEVYSVRDHSNITRVLRKYPDSIVFLNIDEKMPKPEWEKWVRATMTALPKVSIGVMSSNAEDEVKQKYTDELKIPCGFNNLNLDMTRSIPKILDTLKLVNAKGRRKYLRASIERDTVATLNLPYGNDYINAAINDISVVGVSCTFEQDPELKKNTLFKDVQIKLHTTLLKAEAIVFGSRMSGPMKNYVLLFTQRLDPEMRVKIRKYVQGNLQGKMEAELK